MNCHIDERGNSEKRRKKGVHWWSEEMILGFCGFKA